MLKNIVRTLVLSSGIAFLTTSPQAVRAAQHGESFDSRHGRQVKMTFSGSMVPSSIDVQPDTITDEELLAGDGTLGQFTFRKLRTDETTPPIQASQRADPTIAKVLADFADESRSSPRSCSTGRGTCGHGGGESSNWGRPPTPT